MQQQQTNRRILVIASGVAAHYNDVAGVCGCTYTTRYLLVMTSNTAGVMGAAAPSFSTAALPPLTAERLSVAKAPARLASSP